MKKTTNAKISLSPDTLAHALIAMTSVLIVLSTAAKLTDFFTGENSVFLRKMVKFFYVDLEMNAPTFFNMLLLLAAALLLAVVCFLARQKNDANLTKWAVLAVGFLYLAFDEILAIHDRLVEPMQAVLGGENLGILYYGWVVPAVAIIIYLVFYFFRFIMNLPSKTRFYFMLAAAVFIGSSIGFEFLEGMHAEVHGENNLTYVILTTIEEGLEMIGVIVFIKALLVHISENFGELRLNFDTFADQPAMSPAGVKLSPVFGTNLTQHAE